ncbi:MAG: hypothetical protein JXQ96_16695 [Cyclobacteriaceae bacterium]
MDIIFIKMIQRICLIIGLFLIVSFSKAQTVEYSVQLHSSLASFWGGSSSKLSFVDLYLGLYNIENPYGRSPALSYGISTQAQLLVKRYVFGLQVGYDNFKSNTSIHGSPQEEAVYWIDTERSSLVLSNHFLNLYPYIGRRIDKGKWIFDATAGVDIAFSHGGKIRIDITDTNDTKMNRNIDLNGSGIDIRPRVSVIAYNGKFGYFAGYSLGILPYENEIGFESAAEGIYSRIVRLGISYKLN